MLKFEEELEFGGFSIVAKCAKLFLGSSWFVMIGVEVDNDLTCFRFKFD